MPGKAIGGYFELEIPEGNEFHTNAIRLNTGRHSLEYILTAKKYKKIYIPYYTCKVLLEPVRKLSVEVEFYSLNNNFEPLFDFSKVEEREVFLYTNYFGICSKQVAQVAAQNCHVIIDNAQAFFSTPLADTDTFYSARKFFGVPDGAYLYTDVKLETILEFEDSSNRFDHLIKRIEKKPENGYQAFKNNDASFKYASIKKMSKISQKLLQGVDYDRAAEKRRENFMFLHQHLRHKNNLDLNLEHDEVPMAYPFFTEKIELRNYLIKHKIFVPIYWPNVLNHADNSSREYQLTNQLVPLPIDQRYSIMDMEIIIKKIHDYEI